MGAIASTLSSLRRNGPVWWSNAIFFVLVHVAAAIGSYYYPLRSLPRATKLLTLVLWQGSQFGITIGYHRLYAHKTFQAALGIRLVLALAGSGALQGSIKWWVSRHRLHHRWTDDPIHDPYAVTRGLLWAHMGWIFFKPTYERMNLIDRSDIDKDIVVRLQHKYYIPSAIFASFILPVLIGSLWHDTLGAFIWAALVKSVLIWHCTFMVNSLAHWEGIQPYCDDNTSRSNLILALLTCGEGNHNFHAFPHDYRASPETFNYDPSKWIITLLHKLGLVTRLQQVTSAEIDEAKQYMSHKSHSSTDDSIFKGSSVLMADYPNWTLEETRAHAAVEPGRCLLALRGFVVDVTAYMKEHPGGAQLLRRYSIRADRHTDQGFDGGHDGEDDSKRATWAFDEGLNRHSLAAVRRMETFVVARLRDANN